MQNTYLFIQLVSQNYVYIRIQWFFPWATDAKFNDFSMIVSFLEISRIFHDIQWFFHDLETDLNFNDFSRAVGTLILWLKSTVFWFKCHSGDFSWQYVHIDTGNAMKEALGLYINRLVQERLNSIANALELHLSCTNPSIWTNDNTAYRQI